MNNERRHGGISDEEDMNKAIYISGSDCGSGSIRGEMSSGAVFLAISCMETDCRAVSLWDIK